MAGIQDAINQAQNTAAQMAQAQAGTDIIEGHVSQAGVVTTFSKPSMAAVVASTGVIPRNTPYIKVNEFGIRVGKNKDFLTEIPVEISMIEDEGFQVKHTLRFGNPAQYLSTYDGRVCDKGGSWQDAMMKAKQIDPSVDPYPSVDIVVTLTAPLKMKEETLPAGTLLAFNSSKSNFSEWSDFYAEVAKAGRIGETLKVTLGHREISHNGNTWGVVTFSLAE